LAAFAELEFVEGDSKQAGMLAARSMACDGRSVWECGRRHDTLRRSWLPRSARSSGPDRHEQVFAADARLARREAGPAHPPSTREAEQAGPLLEGWSTVDGPSPKQCSVN